MASERSKIQLENIISIIAFIAIIIAWLIGSSKKQADLIPTFNKLFPQSEEFKELKNDVFIPTQNINKDSIVYIGVASSHGYGGEIKLAALINNKGEVQDFIVVDHKETPSFFSKVLHDQFIESLKSTSYKNNFTLGEELDAVSGATYTSKAIATALGKLLKNISEEELNFEMNWQEKRVIEFGTREILLIILFLLGFLFSIKVFPDNKYLKYSYLVFGMLSLGFYYNALLGMTIINKFLLGMWPQLDTHLFVYLLLGAVISMIIFSGKNIYCSHVCPFGSAQKCLGLVGGTNKTLPSKLNKPLMWVQRFLSLSLIIWALIAFNPSIFSYEIFGAFFQLYGTNLQFIILIVILITSLFFRRPWCNYLCPVRPVLDFIKMFRNRVLKLTRQK